MQAMTVQFFAPWSHVNIPLKWRLPYSAFSYVSARIGSKVHVCNQLSGPVVECHPILGHWAVVGSIPGHVRPWTVKLDQPVIPGHSGHHSLGMTDHMQDKFGILRDATIPGTLLQFIPNLSFPVKCFI